MADLGDISGFLREGSVADLDWLDVNEEDYRKLDQLPQQNLDIAPDLQAVWSHEDRPAERLVPNKEAPKTMLDVGQGKTASAETLESVARVARFALMQDARKFQSALLSRFDKDTLQAARPVLAAVLAERGLIGKLYVEGRDFHACARFSKSAVEFVRRFASEAQFLVAVPDCPGCAEKIGSVCSTFQKKIVLEVPYSDELADSIESKKAAQGRKIEASEGLSPKERIRRALSASEDRLETVSTPKPVDNTARYLQPVKAAAKVHLPVLSSQAAQLVQASQSWSPSVSQGKTASVKTALDKTAFEVKATLRREMLKGRSERELVQALKLSFSSEDLQATRTQWEPLFKEAGYYGSIYSTQESFSDCHEGADFLARHASPVKGIVAGDKCGSCIYNKMGRCMMYGRPLVAAKEDLYTPETVQQVVREQRLAGKLETGAEKVAWGETPEAALKNIYRVASSKNETAPMRSIQTAFTGSGYSHVTAGLTRREIVKTARRYMNEGLYGRQLMEALKRQFDTRDLVASKEELRPILAEQGLQGVYYVDPTVYSDYGKGCNEAERLHRARLVEYVKVGSACGSCVHHNGGRCSKLGGKELVADPPYADKAAQQREILASGPSTEVKYEDLVNNGRSMLAEFQMQSEMTVDLDPVKDRGPDLLVALGIGKVKL